MRGMPLGHGGLSDLFGLHRIAALIDDEAHLLIFKVDDLGDLLNFHALLREFNADLLQLRVHNGIHLRVAGPRGNLEVIGDFHVHCERRSKSSPEACNTPELRGQVELWSPICLVGARVAHSQPQCGDTQSALVFHGDSSLHRFAAGARHVLSQLEALYLAHLVIATPVLVVDLEVDLLLLLVKDEVESIVLRPNRVERGLERWRLPGTSSSLHNYVGVRARLSHDQGFVAGEETLAAEYGQPHDAQGNGVLQVQNVLEIFLVHVHNDAVREHNFSPDNPGDGRADRCANHGVVSHVRDAREVQIDLGWIHEVDLNASEERRLWSLRLQNNGENASEDQRLRPDGDFGHGHAHNQLSRDIHPHVDHDVVAQGADQQRAKFWGCLPEFDLREVEGSLEQPRQRVVDRWLNGIANKLLDVFVDPRPHHEDDAVEPLGICCAYLLDCFGAELSQLLRWVLLGGRRRFLRPLRCHQPQARATAEADRGQTALHGGAFCPSGAPLGVATNKSGRP
mmetsp:Transcript_16789/g.36848  ORF Transcript_16789/g.36848 Transcript_16789/m.36848 type:complete len:510 (+) Transcript_16789:401-1930(+)